MTSTNRSRRTIPFPRPCTLQRTSRWWRSRLPGMKKVARHLRTEIRENIKTYVKTGRTHFMDATRPDTWVRNFPDTFSKLTMASRRSKMLHLEAVRELALRWYCRWYRFEHTKGLRCAGGQENCRPYRAIPLLRRRNKFEALAAHDAMVELVRRIEARGRFPDEDWK